MAKRDLGKLGVTSLDQLEQPLPSGIRCTVKLVLRRDDDGTEYNRVRRFDVVGIDEPERDAFAPGGDKPDLADESETPTAELDKPANKSDELGNDTDVVADALAF